MSEQDQALGHLEVVDGRYLLNGEEITEEEAVAAGFEPMPEAEGSPEAASNGGGGDDGAGDVLDRLRAGYSAGQGERRRTIEISPARYNDLAAEFKPIDWDLRRKLIRKANRRGESGIGVDLKINSALMADACVSMMFRESPGAEYVQLHTLVSKYRGGDPIRFDARLAECLGLELVGGESEGDICRLVFGDAGIFEAHYMALNGWSLDAFDVTDDEEEDEGGDRPT